MKKWQLDFDGMFSAMRVVIDADQRRCGEERFAERRVDRHLAEGRAERAGFPERDATIGIPDSGVIGRQNDDERRDGYARKCGGGRWTGIHVAGVRRDSTDGDLTP